MLEQRLCDSVYSLDKRHCWHRAGKVVEYSNPLGFALGCCLCGATARHNAGHVNCRGGSPRITGNIYNIETKYKEPFEEIVKALTVSDRAIPCPGVVVNMKTMSQAILSKEDLSTVAHQYKALSRSPVFGTFGFSGPQLKVIDISHVVDDLVFDGETLIAHITPINTPKGKALAQCLLDHKGGGPLPFFARPLFSFDGSDDGSLATKEDFQSGRIRLKQVDILAKHRAEEDIPN